MENLEEYINGPYEEDPVYQGLGALADTLESVAIRLYRDALVVSRRGDYTKYPLDANATVEADRRANVFHFIQEGGARVSLRVPSVAIRDGWLRHINRLLEEANGEETYPTLAHTADRVSLRDPSSTAPKTFILPPSNSTKSPAKISSLGVDNEMRSWDGDGFVVGGSRNNNNMPGEGKESVFTSVAPALDRATQRDITRQHLTVITRAFVQVAAVFLVYCCIYTLACRIRPVAASIHVITWILCQPQYHIYPWALGPKIVNVLFVGLVCAVNVFLTVMARHVNDTWHVTYPNPVWLGWAATRQLGFTMMLYIVGVAFYIAAYRRGELPIGHTMMGRRGRCQRDTRKLQQVLAVISCIIAPFVESISVFVNFSDLFLVTATFAISLEVVGFVVLTYMGRRVLDEYSWSVLLRYTPTLAFGTYVIGRLTRVLLLTARARLHDGAMDVALPAIFILYKLMFMILYPYFISMTMRIDRRERQMQYLFPVQMLDAFVLDAFAVIAPSISAEYIFFVIVRVLFAVVYQAGLLRKLTDRFGFTSPHWAEAVISGASSSARAPSNAVTPVGENSSKLDYENGVVLSGVYASGGIAGGVGDDVVSVANASISRGSGSHGSNHRVPTLVAVNNGMFTPAFSSNFSTARGALPEEAYTVDGFEAPVTMEDSFDAGTPRDQTGLPGIVSGSNGASVANSVHMTHRGVNLSGVNVVSSSGMHTTTDTPRSSEHHSARAAAVAPGVDTTNNHTNLDSIGRQVSSSSAASSHGSSADLYGAHTIRSDGITNNSAAIQSADMGENSGAKSAANAEIGSRLYALLREPCGDSPLGQWLFFVQGGLAGLMSIFTLMVITAFDKVLPGACILTCDMPLGAIQARASISLAAWLLTVGLTFLIARHKMARVGFSAPELIAATASHLRSSLPVLMTFGLPIAAYMLDFTTVYVTRINGHEPAPGTTPLFGV